MGSTVECRFEGGRFAAGATAVLAAKQQVQGGLSLGCTHVAPIMSVGG
jgi:hypothetical protein